MLQEEIEGVYAAAGLDQPVWRCGSIVELRKAINLLAPQLQFLELSNQPRLPPRIPPVILTSKLEGLTSLSFVSAGFGERELRICQAIPAQNLKTFALSHPGQLLKQFTFSRDPYFDYKFVGLLLEKLERVQKIALPVHHLEAAHEFLSKLPDCLEELDLRHLSPVDTLTLKHQVEPRFRKLKVFKSRAPIVLSENVAAFFSTFTELRELNINIISNVWIAMAIKKYDREKERDEEMKEWAFLSQMGQLESLAVKTELLSTSMDVIPHLHLDQLATYPLAMTLTTLQITRVVLQGVSKDSVAPFHSLSILGLDVNGPQSEQLLELVLPQLKKLHLYSLMFSSIAERVGRRGGPKLELVDMKCKGVARNARLHDVSQKPISYKFFLQQCIKVFSYLMVSQVHNPAQKLHCLDCQFAVRKSCWVGAGAGEKWAGHHSPTPVDSPASRRPATV